MALLLLPLLLLVHGRAAEIQLYFLGTSLLMDYAASCVVRRDRAAASCVIHPKGDSLSFGATSKHRCRVTAF
jgi:hypothetical protein